MIPVSVYSPPETMRAAVYRRFGDPNVIEVVAVPRPHPRRGEVLIRVLASTVSTADHRSRSKDVPRGLAILASATLGFTAPRIPILGMDVAGIIEEIGEGVHTLHPGDEVIAMLGASFGGHAEYVTIPFDGAIAPKPASRSFEDAVALVFGGITARAFLREADVRPGSRILVNGASGAVGSAAVQLAADTGAHVTAVCSSRNRELVLSLGADRVLDYEAIDFAAEGREYDIIMDAVGNAPFERVESLLRPGGALLLVVSDLKGVLMAPARSRFSGKRVITGPGRYRAEDLRHLADLAEAGRIRPVIDRTYGLDEIVDAHRYVDRGRKRGSVVLRVGAAGRTPITPSATEGKNQ